MDKTTRLKKYAFPQREKLKSKKLIEQLFAEGKAVTVFPLKLIYLPIAPEDDVQFKTMVVAPKKNFKSAVKRNRIKRLLREAYRLNKPNIFNNIEGNFALAILYIGKEMPDYRFVENKTKGLLEQFVKKYNHE